MTDDARITRPTGITIIAWLWIATGVLMGLSAAMGGLAYSIMQDAPKLDSNLPSEFGLLGFVLENIGLLIALQCVVVLISIWAGASLLRLRAWAKVAIEGLSWLGLLYIVGFGVYWLSVWFSIGGRMSGDSGESGLDMVQTIGAVTGVVVTLTFAVPLGVMVWYLRGREVRDAIAQAERARA